MENDKKKTFSLHHQGCINDYPLAFGTSLHQKACNFNKDNCIMYMARLRNQENRMERLDFFHCLLVSVKYTCNLYGLLEFLCSNTWWSLFNVEALFNVHYHQYSLKKWLHCKYRKKHVNKQNLRKIWHQHKSFKQTSV